ncbi:MAG: PAS domain S-box protein [Methanospirillum sp.]
MTGLLPNSANLSVTVFNVSSCIAAAFELAGALTVLAGWREERVEHRAAFSAAVYAVVAVVAVGIMLAALLRPTPAVFVPCTGSTTLRDLVPAGAVEFLLLASGLFFVLYRKREDDFFWYAIGLAILGLGLIAATIIVIFGGPLNRAARLGQYLGACYILIAFLALQHQASGQSVSVQEMLASFFAEAGYRELVETAGDAIVVLDPALRVLIWNTAAEQLFGYTPDEAIGLTFSSLLGAADITILLQSAGPPEANGPRLR